VQAVQSGLSVQQIDTLDAQLRREGWSLHQRLEAAIAAVHRPQSSAQLESWRLIVAPDSPINFDKRLDWDGLDAGSAAWVLNPPAEATPQRPAWWPLLEALRQAGRDAAAAEGTLQQSLQTRGSQQPFVHVWRPAAAWALETLQQRCADLQPALPLSEAAWLDLAEALLERLCNTADQALWEQFNQRRTPGQMLLAHLGANGDGTGEPVHEAYDTFVAELLSSGYGLVLAEFPVLGRLLAVITDLWLEGSEEMLRRLADSRAALQQHFAVSTTAHLQSVQLGLSDPHRGGRAVAILTFGEGDEARKVVYKPKDMQVDATYQRYLQALNDASTLEPLRCLTIVNRDGYGFMEWVEHRPCSDDAELARFYTNAGRTMAVLHLLGCTDCHYENLIASGDQLVLIDTETLLEADLRDLISDDGDDPDLLSPLQTSMQGSVLRSGLLPQWLMAGAGRKRAFDISALGIQPPPPEREMPGWLGLNSDGMMAGRSSQPCELPTSLPVELGSPQRLTDYIDELCTGFANQLQEALRLRPLLLTALDGFNGQPRRLVARATRLYFTIQRQMLEPASLRNAVVHGLKLEQLSRSFVLASEKPLNWPMFKAELLQMERLDIPFFEHLIDGEELPLPEGLAPIPDFMKSSGLTAARRRLDELDAAEIEFQQQLIRGAIAARHLKSAGAARTGEASEDGSTNEVADLGADVYRSEAFRLGEELWSAAIRDRKGRPEWLGMDLGADGESFHFGLIGNSLYSGCSGIALLFARLAVASEGEAGQTWSARAWACFEGLDELAERNSNDQLFRMVRDLPFGISGTGGTLLTLLLLQEAGLEQAAPLVELLVQQLRPERLQADESIDIIGGVSGLIGTLLMTGLPRGLELATACGDRLLALQQDNGGWSAGAVSSLRRPPLTGFSHGAAGMAAALARLAHGTGEQRFADAARRAVAYERSVFDSERGNWPDFRSSDDPNEFMLSWCHGAPGILLSRLVLQASGLGDAAMEAERQVARESTLAVLDEIAATRNDYAGHLCCGSLGLTSLLQVDAQVSGVPLSPRVAAAESKVISNAIANGGYSFFSVDTGSLNLPGLFTGKAGVALALLEAATGQQAMPAVLSAGLLLP
jgi:type 2 lantibiotic biosynthesis protein LanM